MTIAHITPALPPTINGLGDFSKILVDNLKEKGFSKNYFLVLTKSEVAKEIKEPIFEFNKTTLFNYLEKVNPSTIILHYVGYAYEKNGLPFYLAELLNTFKKKHECTILTFFHELYSSSSNPFKIPFYSSFFQKKIVTKLYKLSSVTFTNCEVYQEMLQKLVVRLPLNNICTGIYSNIPESYYNPSINKRNDLMVVFGSFSKRITIYKNPAFAELLNRLEIKKLYDLGPGAVSFNHSFIDFIAKGSLPPCEIAELLNEARFGAIDYEREILGKSGIYSAYTAFGVIPININTTEEKLRDNLVEGYNYFDVESDLNMSELDTIKAQVKDWYSTRSTKLISDKIARYLN